MDRSENMRRIRSRDTAPEIWIRRQLHARGFRYSLQAKNVPGRPDLWLPKWNAAIFVNGCFWHRHAGCKYAYTPKTRLDFWQAKFDANVRRDETVRNELRETGIRRLVVWECTVRRMKRSAECNSEIMEEITAFLRSDEAEREI